MADEKIEITPYDTPWEVACMLINAKYERMNIFGQKEEIYFFDNDDLRRIGEHLANYSKTEHLKENDDD